MMSVRDARVCTCKRIHVLYTISYHVHAYKITIGASLISLSVSLSVSVPWDSSFMAGEGVLKVQEW